MKLYRLVPLLLLLAACGREPEPVSSPAPVLVSTSPEDGAGNLVGSTLSVTFTFDQNIRCTAQAQQGITVDQGAAVSGVSAYGPELTVSLTGLGRGRSYTLTLPAGTVEGYKTRQEATGAILFRFSTREPAPTPGPDDWESAATAAAHMGVGWNLGNTLDSNSGDVGNMWIEAFSQRNPSDYETAWGQPLATRELIHMFKEAGFNTIRVPVTWYPHMGTVSVSVADNHGIWDKSTWTGYDVDARWMARVREVVGYVLDEGMYCILNVHHDTGTSSTAWLRADEAVYAATRERFTTLWTTIATEFRDCGPNLLFESFNEMLDARGTWNYSTPAAHEVINKYNADFVATVRATGGGNARRNLILNTYAASCLKEALQDFRLPGDTAEGHLLAEVHSYAPYHFAFKTSTPKTVFDAACEAEVQGLVENMNTYLVSRGIPCVLGEFGADTSERADTELAKQAKCYVTAAAKYHIPCLYWMTLSDGSDRSVPKWTKPVIKDALLQAYWDYWK